MHRATFIDADVPIYAAGREHPYREPCIRVLAAVNENPDGFVTDAEVFQEIMHHYRRTQRWDAGQTVVESFAAMMRGRVSPVTIDAVMRRLGVTRIVTADADFGRVPGAVRLDPVDFGEWEPA